MKVALYIDMDTERPSSPIRICKPPDFPQPRNEEELQKIVADDLAAVCQAAVTLIHVAEKVGVRSSAESLRICIEHLTRGFADASFKAILHDQNQPEPLDPS